MESEIMVKIETGLIIVAVAAVTFFAASVVWGEATFEARMAAAEAEGARP